MTRSPLLSQLDPTTRAVVEELNRNIERVRLRQSGAVSKPKKVAWEHRGKYLQKMGGAPTTNQMHKLTDAINDIHVSLKALEGALKK